MGVRVYVRACNDRQGKNGQEEEAVIGRGFRVEGRHGKGQRQPARIDRYEPRNSTRKRKVIGY